MQHSIHIVTERIRNTLSHEMCHLACWIINRNLKENHGNIWKGWSVDNKPSNAFTYLHLKGSKGHEQKARRRNHG